MLIYYYFAILENLEQGATKILNLNIVKSEEIT